jgi:hypothetical protein
VFKQQGALNGPAAEVLADALIIGGSRQEVAAVYVGGEMRARDGAPVAESQDQEYAATIARLL